jgi:sulfofructose kinase
VSAALICLGHAALDHIYRIEAFPPAPVKLRALASLHVGGGMAATAAVAAARLGGRVAFWGRIGEDRAGEAIRAGLADEGVDVAGLHRIPGAVSSTSAIIVDAAGERLIVNHRGEGLAANPAWLPLGKVAAADAVLADLRWPEGALALFGAARAAGVSTVLDIDADPGPQLAALLRLTDHAVFSTLGLGEFAPGADLAAALAAARAAGARIAGVTRGADGFLWLDADGGVRHQPRFPVRAVDTTGAGDAFHGAYALAVAERQPVAAAARFAAAVAALKCTRPGGRAGLPTRAELCAFLATHPSPAESHAIDA